MYQGPSEKPQKNTSPYYYGNLGARSERAIHMVRIINLRGTVLGTQIDEQQALVAMLRKARKFYGGTSKYKPHQCAQEKARRVARGC